MAKYIKSLLSLAAGRLSYIYRMHGARRLILSSHLCLGLPSGLFPSGVPPKSLYTPLFPPIYSICLTHHILLDFITRTILGDKYRSLSSSLCCFACIIPTNKKIMQTVQRLFNENIIKIAKLMYEL